MGQVHEGPDAEDRRAGRGLPGRGRGEVRAELSSGVSAQAQ